MKFYQCLDCFHAMEAPNTAGRCPFCNSEAVEISDEDEYETEVPIAIQSRNKREGYYVGKHSWTIHGDKVHFYVDGRKRHHRGNYPTIVNTRKHMLSDPRGILRRCLAHR